MPLKRMKLIQKLKKVDLRNDNFLKLYCLFSREHKTLILFNGQCLTILNFYLEFLISYKYVIRKR